MHTNELAHWLAINSIFAASTLKIIKWYNHFGTINNIFNYTMDDLIAYGFNQRQAAAVKNPNWRQVELELSWLQQTNHACVVLTDTNYPTILRQIPDPPLLLYVEGNLDVFQKQHIAIVGARNATPQGQLNAESFAAVLASENFVITSGLARGIDAAAHRGALKVQGTTVAVAGTGLKQVYPREHRKLVTEIVNKQGACVSEFALDTLPCAHHFPKRNRIIAGLAKGVLVVEAAVKSGSLITATCALENGRDIFAIPGSIHHPLAKGCHNLIQQGAKLCQSPSDILEEFGMKNNTTSQLSDNKSSIYAALSQEEQVVLNEISDEITAIDMIILRSRLTASEVSSILLALELQGYIKCVTGGYLRIFSK